MAGSRPICASNTPSLKRVFENLIFFGLGFLDFPYVFIVYERVDRRGVVCRNQGQGYG